MSNQSFYLSVITIIGILFLVGFFANKGLQVKINSPFLSAEIN